MSSLSSAPDTSSGHTQPCMPSTREAVIHSACCPLGSMYHYHVYIACLAGPTSGLQWNADEMGHDDALYKQPLGLSCGALTNPMASALIVRCCKHWQAAVCRSKALRKCTAACQQALMCAVCSVQWHANRRCYVYYVQCVCCCSGMWPCWRPTSAQYQWHCILRCWAMQCLQLLSLLRLAPNQMLPSGLTHED